ncbi:hypothetical protein PUW24_12630 [Paenibacillus urinalis]|uniref:H-type small acid-soluble spore protein n=1 Tax=Paenibacillus urinalis TaxID=521520 RepID=A0AAX3N2V0_9BACL|nr:MULTISPECIES: hypothetical protein [Paenibacillus]WDH83633.1 hypothetical protein PUW23_05215 [Paenibacillus urinalis]WDH99661.1 hypothetical protein PUW24_12630 [Paenibacillus urinalis]WDI03293.1 hypothetical protein PUW25_04760 [Paenibacillus urinalis]GAK42398.1 hypothetical protein TCA2_4890 [Paenibacillus sp. TCA20]
MENTDSYKFAELNDQGDAVELIQRTEALLTEQYGAPITLIAYEVEKDKDSAAD